MSSFCTAKATHVFSKKFQRICVSLDVNFNESLTNDVVSFEQLGLEFYGDLVYRFRKMVGKSYFSKQFKKLIYCYRSISYSLDIMRQTTCLVVNPITVDSYASFFNCTTAVRASDSMTALHETLTSGLKLDNMSLAWPAVVKLLVFIYSGIQ